MKRKILAGLLLFCLIIGSMPISVFAEPVATTTCIHHPEHTPECGYIEDASEDVHVHTQECYESVTKCIHVHTDECYPDNASAESTESAESSATDENGESSESTESDENAEADESDESSESTESDENAEADESSESIESDENAEADESDESNESAGFSESTENAEPVESEESAESMEGTAVTEPVERITVQTGVSDAREATECTHVCSVESGCITITDHLICGYDTEGSDGANGGASADVPEDSCNFVCAICPIQERIDALPVIESLEGMDEAQRDEIFAEIEAIFAAIAELTEEEAAQLDTTLLDAAAAFFQALGAEEFPELVGDYTVPAVNPEHVQIDLFDYWLYERDKTDCGYDPDIPGSNASIHSWQGQAFFSGINTGHAFLFSKGGLDNGDKGSFNHWTGGSGAAWLRADGSGIVSRELVDGYPVLNLTEAEVKKSFDIYKGLPGVNITEYPDSQESLAYLFSPAVPSEYKASFTDVEGLFQMDADGNYYYNSQKNFAEFVESENRFKLYNQWAVNKNDDSSINGQFFPFNTSAQVFKENTANQTIDGSKRECRNPMMNHYFGMVMSAQFQQPNKGMLSNAGTDKPMKFTFSGDDDVWIFIDGVLVADLGGIHDPMTTTIDFSTGIITTARVKGGNQRQTTLKAQFEAAGRTDTAFTAEGTFADQSVHELKMFYLERGNVASNLSLSFNLMEANYSELIKLDQNGDPLGGVTFDLYEADSDFNVSGASIASFTVDASGSIDLATVGADGKKHPISLADGGHYVLRETATPAGYVTTEDIHLTYSRATNTLTINNQWETGAVGRFKTQIIQAGAMRYEDGGDVDLAAARDGLILAVPFLNPSISSGGADVWQPVYGSTTTGFNMIDVEDSQNLREAALEAMLRQLADPESEHWHLAYNGQLNRFEGVLEDLPGSADRYRLVNPAGDLHIAYYLLTDVSGSTAEEKIAQLTAQLNQGGAEALEANIEALIGQYLSKVQMLDIKDFQRQFYTQLYIPNKVRDLWIDKVDENGAPLQGAEFTLYEDEACTVPVAMGITDANGNISFSAQNQGGNAAVGGALSSLVYFPLDRIDNPDGTRSSRSYWLKETKAPAGYEENPSVIEVRVTKDSIYVNAGTPDDGVSVVKGLGRLLQTMVEFASDDEMNITLRDVKATKYILDGQLTGENLPVFGEPDWEKTDEVLNLHYGLDKALMDYGLHDPDAKPYFEAEEGWMGFGLEQNYSAHTDPGDPYGGSGYKEDLSGIDISALLTGSTAVIVKNNRETGALTLSKTVSGNAGDRTKLFNFEITLADENGQPLSGSFEYTGASSETGVNPPASGVLTFDAAGVANVSLSHGQSITLTGLPMGTAYSVTEEEANQDDYTTVSTGEQGTITKDGVTAAFTNTKEIVAPPVETGSLTVSKTVAGDAGDKTRAFNFTVTLDDKTIDGDYGDMTFDKGVATFTLKDGQSRTATDLPVGTEYTVVEQEANQDGYTTNASGDKGAIVKAGSTAAFTNMKESVDPPEPPAETGSLTVSKTVAGDAGDKTRAFNFTVTLDDEAIDGDYGEMHFIKGVAAFTLKDGQSKTAINIPVGTAYTVVEQEANQDGYTTNASGDKGTIVKDGSTAAFTNVKESVDPPDPEPPVETGSLTVSKTVAGDAGDKTRAFNFAVTLDDETIDGDYGEMHFTKGVATFTLKNGESKIAKGLPVGTVYTVVEKEANQDGYTTTYVGNTGTINSAGTAASFVNTKNDTPENPDPEPPAEVGNLAVFKTVSGDAAEQDHKFTFRVTLDDKSVDGKYGDMTFKEGVAEFTLKHGENLTATRLPVGTEYTVVEIDSDGYLVTKSGDVGTIRKNITLVALFNNHKDNVPPETEEPQTEETEPETKETESEMPDTEKPQESTKPGESETQQSTDDIPKTGEDRNIGVWVVILIISGLGLVLACVVYFFQKKKNDKK